MTDPSTEHNQGNAAPNDRPDLNKRPPGQNPPNNQPPPPPQQPPYNQPPPQQPPYNQQPPNQPPYNQPPYGNGPNNNYGNQAPVDNSKTIAVVSYITLIGWIVAIILHTNDRNKSPFAAFHLRQALGLFCTWVATWILSLFFMFIPIINILFVFVAPAVMLGVFAFLILGIVNAVNNETKPLPLVGEFYQRIFAQLG
jgi:uncharacterized membrane protein